MKSKYWPEALASLMVVGLGQIIKGEGKKGLLLLLLFYFVLPISVYLSLLIHAYLFLVVFSFSLLCAIVVWIYNIWDALTHETLN